MSRSGDVTAAAIVLFFGSALLILFLLFGILGAALVQRQMPLEERYVQLFGLSIYAVFAAWGIATGVGILQLRSWARISILVMSGIAIFSCVFGAIGLATVPMILRQTPDLPPAATSVFVAIGVAMLLAPTAIAIWWLVLFTRKRVIAEFAARGAEPVLAAAASFEAGVPEVSTPQIPAPASPPIPLSIRIIAVFFIASAGFMLADVPFIARLHVPNVILGILVYRWPAWSFVVCFAVLNAGLAAATLLKKKWALDGLIALSLFSAVNTLMFWISPAREQYMDAVMRQETARMPTLPPGMSLDAVSSMMRTIFPIAFSGGLVLTIVVLYFLVARRSAFRAACATHASNTSAGSGL